MSRVSRLLILAAGMVCVLGFTAPRAWASGCNLYMSTSSCTYNGGVFNVVGPQPTGTGVIDSFLRVQQKGAEEGFNTGLRPMLCDGRTCDDKTDPNYTRDLLSSTVPVVTINGTKYREFFLDINEPAGGTQYLTLDQVQIYVSNTADLGTHTTGAPGSDSLTGATKVYDMETGGTDSWVNLNYLLVGGGSGSGDMVLYVPDSVAFSNNQYVYLYSEFGCGGTFTASLDCGHGSNTKYQSQAGFEEWWVPGSTTTTTTAAVPEPTTLILLGTGMMLLVRRYRTAKPQRRLIS
jgi:PEP-CTERM motif